MLDRVCITTDSSCVRADGIDIFNNRKVFNEKFNELVPTILKLTPTVDTME